MFNLKLDKPGRQKFSKTDPPTLGQFSQFSQQNFFFQHTHSNFGNIFPNFPNKIFKNTFKFSKYSQFSQLKFSQLVFSKYTYFHQQILFPNRFSQEYSQQHRLIPIFPTATFSQLKFSKNSQHHNN